jgi:hypothetical protein
VRDNLVILARRSPGANDSIVLLAAGRNFVERYVGEVEKYARELLFRLYELAVERRDLIAQCARFFLQIVGGLTSAFPLADFLADGVAGSFALFDGLDSFAARTIELDSFLYDRRQRVERPSAL